MAINFDGKGNIEATTEDGVIAVKLYSLEKQIEEKNKEINRLNNIINELEKDINNEIMMTRKFDEYNEGFFNATLHFYNKLKELKEGNK